MTQSRSNRAEELFAQLFDLPIDERTDRLRDACGSDVQLRRRVETLLANYDEPLTSLATVELGASATSAAATALPKRVGEYRILSKLGRGGMGIVFRAEQERPRREVALKLLLPTQLEEEARKRLALEVEVLGRLQHPGIAQIFDAGFDSSPLGDQPFFAMELIDGLPLTTHCDTEHADTESRCRLIEKICDAAQHAHERGVIHRDLKPANVLVAAIDGHDPQPKILDFGIARCMDSSSDAGTRSFGTLTTQSGLLIGTLSYMSPEQFLHGEADARSDVYSIGVMLYELLTGSLPHEFDDKSMTEVSRLFADANPQPIRRAEHIPVDLRTILARALAKEPEERYQSAAALRDDVRRFLTHQPIHARPLTVRYQLRKFARRHKAVVAGLLTTALALVVGTLVSIAYMLDAQRARASAELEAVRSQRSEYVAQLTTAATAMRLDPDAAATALERVQESAGLEWRILDARNGVAVPLVGGGVVAEGTRVATQQVAAGRVLELWIEEECATVRSGFSGDVLQRFPGRFCSRPHGNRIARDGSFVTLLDREPPVRIRVYDLAKNSVRCELGWSKYREPRDVHLTLGHDSQYASLWSGEWSRRHVHLGTLTTTDFEEAGEPCPDPILPGIWYADKLIRWSDGEEIMRLRGPGSTAHSMHAFPSPDGKFVIMRGNSHRNLEVMNRQTGELVRRLPGHASIPRQAAWSHDGTMLATCDWASIRLWDTGTWQCVRTFVSTAQFSSFAKDDRELFAMQDPFGPSVRLPARPAANRVLRGHSDYVLAGALDSTGRVLASGDTSGQLLLWDLETGDCLSTLQLGAQIEELQFADDGWTLNSQVQRRAGTRVSLLHWSIETTGSEWWHRHSTRWRTKLVDADTAWAVQRRWNKELGTVDQIVLEHSVPSRSPQRYTIAVPNPGLPTTRIAADRRHVARIVLRGRTGVPFCVHTARSEACIALDDGSIAVVDLQTKTLIAQLLGHQGPALTVTYTRDGSRLLTGGLDGYLRFWDTSSWELLYAEKAHDRAIELILVTPKGDRVVTLSADRTIQIWDAEPRTQRLKCIEAERPIGNAARLQVDRLWGEYNGDATAIAEAIRNSVDPRAERWPHVLRHHLARIGEGK